MDFPAGRLIAESYPLNAILASGFLNPEGSFPAACLAQGLGRLSEGDGPPDSSLRQLLVV
ncbi:MAG TPA: hypothetical protein VLM91_07105 [Candidatus Methylomirabilis sp.]|nr:hypothetical protein [Candidatus Methylomirabilis sp.]